MTTQPHTPAASNSAPATPEDPEQKWLREVYKGDSQPQLTTRAIVMGLLLGSFMSFSNLYVGLKTGWGLGVAITACIMSWAIFKALRPLLSSEPSILENNCMQSTASAAGYSTGSTLVSAFSAHLMITGQHMPMGTTMLMVFCLALLGVFMAIPMKRNMINVEQLAFPSGTAAAETLKSLYTAGEEAVKKARTLFMSMGAGGVVAFLRDGLADFSERFKWNVPALPNFLPIAAWLKGAGLEKVALIFDPKGYTFSFELSTIMVGAGALMGIRVGASMLAGAVLLYGILAPVMHAWPTGEEGKFVIQNLGYRGIVSWGVWGGVSMMTTASLFNFFSQMDTLKRAFGEMAAVFKGKQGVKVDPMADIEVPASWFLGGSFVAALGCIAALWFSFGINPLLGALSIAISFVLAIVACRATGETDTTPIGALGKITQLTYGILIPQNMTANIMTANVTSSIAISSADLLTDLKSGYLLGANPRKQFWAQFAGVFAGTLVAVPGFYLLVPNAAVLGSEKFPAPAAQVWKAVAELLAKGVDALHPTALWSMLIFGVAGVVITWLEKKLPHKRHLIPSPTAMGLAFVIPAWNSISMCLGAFIAWRMSKKDPEGAEARVTPVASGLIAGESLIGVGIAIIGVLYDLAYGGH